MTPSGLPILTYHAIDRSNSVIATDPSWFDETMAALFRAGYSTIDPGRWLDAGRPSLARRFAITFDDGLDSIWNAVEVLARYRFSATVFVVTGRLGSDNRWPGQPRSIPGSRTLSWRELAELLAAGMEVGSHTVSHARLNTCDPTTLERELRGSRDQIEQRLGRPCRWLAYPYGRASHAVQRAAATWYAAAFGTRLGLASESETPFLLSRIDSYYLRSERALKRLASGRLEAWLRVRRALREARSLATTCLGN